MDQFYINYEFTASSPTSIIQPPLTTPIIQPTDFQSLQLQASQLTLSTLVQSYISSILIALRLHPNVISTSISARAVRDIRNVVQVASLRTEVGGVKVSGVKDGRGWSNAEFVPLAVELCTSFRLRIEREDKVE